jgi:hypothetical protein
MLLRHAARTRGRSGITLTEILISIMILGVGIVSLATLFPLGLVRLRNAQRMSRSGLLAESIKADLNTHNLLVQFSFMNALISPWYVTTDGVQYNPWIQDTPAYPTVAANLPNGVSNSVGAGLPVAYDPLWRAVATNPFTGTPGVYMAPGVPASEARFGSGIGFLRPDPNPTIPNLNGVAATTSTPSANGLQRLTNFTNTLPNYKIILSTFVSPEDLIMQEAKGKYIDPNGTGQPVAGPSTVVPDLTMGPPLSPSPSVTNDWRYSWMFTGVQADVSNGTVFTGDVVVFENRQFGYDQVAAPYSGTAYQATGETVVEAVWGYTTTNPGNGTPYGNGNSRQVLLRWPATLPDPDVHVGGWIADVTYERLQVNESARTFDVYPLQRCEWYQIAKRTDPAPAGVTWTGDGTPYRSMMVWTSAPVRAKTPMNFAAAPPQPVHVEAALIAPGVVNVFPKTVYTK